jgi:hypothetical protein
MKEKFAMLFRQPHKPVPEIKHTAGSSARLVGLLLVAASVALVGCASGTSSTTTTVATGGSVPSPSPTAAAEAALNAYRAMWADLVDAARTSNFESSLLSKHASGSTLSLLVQGLARDQEQHIVTRGSPIIDPKITSLSPTHNPERASIADCFDDSHWIEYKNHGGLAKNTAPGRRATKAMLTNVDGTWKVTQLTIAATGTC